MARNVPSGEHVGKIGIVRGGRLSEFFLYWPAIKAVRQQFPNAELVLFGDDWQKGFLQHYPDVVDRVEVLPFYVPFEMVRHEQPLKRFLTRIAKEDFDLILQMQDDGVDTNPMVLAMGPKMSAGFGSLEAEPLDVSLPYITHQHETLRAFELLEAIGINDYSLQPEFKLNRADHAGYSDYYKSDGRELIIIHPGANDPRRRWPTENFAETADYFINQGYRVIITANIIEYAIAEAVLYDMEEPAEALVGVLSLPAMLALQSKARLLISNDTGPLQAAQSVGTPCIGLYWGLNVLHSGPLYTQRHRALVDWQLSCPVCGDSTLLDRWPATLPAPGGCKHDASLVQDIEPFEVIEAAEQLLLDTVTGTSV